VFGLRCAVHVPYCRCSLNFARDTAQHTSETHTPTHTAYTRTVTVSAMPFFLDSYSKKFVSKCFWRGSAVALPLSFIVAYVLCALVNIGGGALFFACLIQFACLSSLPYALHKCFKDDGTLLVAWACLCVCVCVCMCVCVCVCGWVGGWVCRNRTSPSHNTHTNR